MYELGVVKRNIVRADARRGRQAWRVRRGDRARSHGPRRPDEAVHAADLCRARRCSGTAVTVLLHPGDNWMMHVAAEQIQPGDIVVAAVHRRLHRRLFRRPAGDELQGARRARPRHRRRRPRREGS